MVEVDAEVLRIFGFWGSILVLKVLAMVPLTAQNRFRKQVFANPEDVALANSSKAKVVYNDPDVERVRRAHQNDLENVLPWFIITYLYLTTGPSVALAAILIRSFVIARIFHTLSYAVFPQQPTRAIAFFVGFGVTGYQALVTLMHYS